MVFVRVFSVTLAILHLITGKGIEFRSSCSFKDDDFEVHIGFEPTEFLVTFLIQINSATDKMWTGIGIGDSFKDSDFIAIIRQHNHFQIQDAHINEFTRGYPSVDFLQNVKEYRTVVQNNQIFASFARDLITNDPQDKNLIDCFNLLIPKEHGRISPTGQLLPLKLPPAVHKICDVAVLCNTLDKKITATRVPEVPITNSVNIPPPPMMTFTTATTTSEPVYALPIRISDKPVLTSLLGGATRTVCQSKDLRTCQAWFGSYLQTISDWVADEYVDLDSRFPEVCRKIEDFQGGVVRRFCCNLFNSICASQMHKNK